MGRVALTDIGFLEVAERGGGYRCTKDGRRYGVATLYDVRPDRLPTPVSTAT